MSVVIQVDRLSKQYRLGQIGGKRLVDDVNRWWARFRGKEDPLSKVGQPKTENRKQKTEIKSDEGHDKFQLSSAREVALPISQAAFPISDLRDDTLWALKDVSFEVKQGEVLGIIGRNGAGKSTLLKILSRVTGPTAGEVRVKGRIASLLEVGTGFHPELTGRENIFLNGAILGMTKAEIRKRFDEIVAFSEVEQFIDTPVKRYSSGMTVRLAFAVAAHLEPEILIVDEVLAVGDTRFQERCLGKMKDVSRAGKTVLIVSHNLGSITTLCSSAILLESGMLRLVGSPEETIQRYLLDSVTAARADLSSHPGRTKQSIPLITEVRIEQGGTLCASLKSGHPATIKVKCKKTGASHKRFSTGILIRDRLGNRVAADNSARHGVYEESPEQDVIFSWLIPHLDLNPGHYSLSLFLGNGLADSDVIHNAIAFDVVWDNSSSSLTAPDPAWGPLCIPCEWRIGA